MWPTHLLCFDLEGTLIDSATRQGPPANVREYVEILEAAGAASVLLTGQTRRGVLPALEDPMVGLTPKFVVTRDCKIYPAPDIGSTAFQTWNATIDFAHKSARQEFADDLAELREFAVKERVAAIVDIEASLGEFLCADYAGVEKLCRFIDQLRHDAPLVRYYCNKLHLRLGLVGVNKGTAIAELATSLGISSRDIFAIGDDHDDLDMLSGGPARRVACPANAIPIVKASVTRARGFVATTCAGSGVAEALYYNFFRG